MDDALNFFSFARNDVNLYKCPTVEASMRSVNGSERADTLP